MNFDRNNYISERILGKGGFGEVHLVRSNDELFALKIIPKNLHTNSIESASREIRAAQLLRHENLTELFDYFETEENIYLVYEYFEGYDLYSLLQKRNLKPLPEKIVQRIAFQLFRVVDFCHNRGIAHRDIKLQNVMVNQKGMIKLIDFGLCHFTMNAPLCVGPVGSRGYMAPEVSLGSWDPLAADGWSCGVVIFALLTARLPFGSTPSQRFPKLRWGGVVSAAGEECISLLLLPSPSLRLSLRLSSSSEWLRSVQWPL